MSIYFIRDYALAAVLSFLVAAILNFVRRKIRAIFSVRKGTRQVSYSERLCELIGSLSKATDEVDLILVEMGRVAKDRSENVQLLEKELRLLETKEKAMKEKIALLQNTPLPVVEQFAKLLEPGERRSARRDLVLFSTGVVLSTIIAIILQLFGPTHRDPAGETSRPAITQPALPNQLSETTAKSPNKVLEDKARKFIDLQ